mmetsp:Transcript_46/g.109  ORF Transcript_46/g.109 Transcript_46/m.109 type:complete len:299 (-) Transcript_46:218-1114(-)|eukprot:CAMPEP_0118937726 /NCGR_PEP_ID=MMETSP1169-20130426/23599_1 /TAXON_ID=36882 /ORGANISM="Pyramimonas obovata, Strain CCMP722" /LENGTH=298 /DNA_ID=CAMNT_0006881445 /DNA_START=34 /DNA_END=930 /DNA_ORIENTATION=+
MARVVRGASHAGSWYEHDGRVLDQELESWLETAKSDNTANGGGTCRAIIAPHAGYRYSGPCAAYAYEAIVSSQVKRVFLLGPSHHWYLRTCALSKTSVYRTPLGDIDIDAEVYNELASTGEFKEMPLDVDEAEHSLEMHLPYIFKIMHGQAFTLVPILVGALSPDGEAHYGKILSKYMDDPSNLFVISSDFCHWGQRFSYTFYNKKCGPIHKSIEVLDKTGMEIIERKDIAGFTDYLQEYGNTICGRHPIGVLLNVLQSCANSDKMQVKFVRYEQSSQCKCMNDSSVSYASAVISQAP